MVTCRPSPTAPELRHRHALTQEALPQEPLTIEARRADGIRVRGAVPYRIPAEGDGTPDEPSPCAPPRIGIAEDHATLAHGQPAADVRLGRAAEPTAYRLSLPCSAEVRFLPRLEAGVPTEES